MTDETQVNPPSRTLGLGLAFIAGLGLTLMLVAAGIGVTAGDRVDSASLGLFFAVGVAMLATGILAWFVVVRPDTHFDDINQPMYHGHHDDH